MIIAVRLRGGISVTEKIKDTMDLMNLKYINNAVLLAEVDTNKGMLQKAKDYITWGEVSLEALETILPRAIKEESLKANKFKTYKDCAKALIDGKANAKDLGFNKIRLHPARGGLKTIKRPFTTGGDLGYRGEAINDLIVRMR